MNHRQNPNKLFFDLLLSSVFKEDKKCQGDCQCQPQKEGKVNLNDFLRQAQDQVKNVRDSDPYQTVVRQAAKFGEKVAETFRQSGDGTFQDDVIIAGWNSDVGFPYKLAVEDKEESHVVSVVVPGIVRENLEIDTETSVDELSLIVLVKSDGVTHKSPPLSLNPKADLDKLSAKLDLGILTITIPFKKVEKRSFDIA